MKVRTKDKRIYEAEELSTFSVIELCALYANACYWFDTEGRMKGANGKIYSGIKRRVNAELKKRVGG